MQLQFWFADS